MQRVYNERLPKMATTPSGLIDVRQATVNGWEISYNPDNEKFCVHEANGDVVAQYKHLRNSRTWAKAH